MNQQISEEAATWFIDFRFGDVDAAQRRAFESWVRGSPEHLRAYLEYAAIWSEGDAVDTHRTIDVDALIAGAGAEDNVLRIKSEAQRERRPGVTKAYRRIAAAAMVLLVAGAATLGYFQRFHGHAYSTDVGEQRSFRLADGSTVELNSRSRLRVRFDDSTERRVELLEGQALFQVAPDAARPFVVHSGATRVRAVGTRFDVNRKGLATVVTVVEGKVAAGGLGGPPVLLSAGEQLALSPGTAATSSRADMAAATAWTQRRIILKSAPLSEVAEEFNRYSERRLTARDTAGEPLSLSGVFLTDPDFLLRYLKARSDITVIETDTGIEIVHHD